MGTFRTVLLRHRAMAFALLALALAMKALVPAGTMIGTQSKVLTIQICYDTQMAAAAFASKTRDIVVPMKGDPAGKHDKHDKAGGPCAFGALGFAGLAGADPVQLALALLFILAAGFAAPALPAPRRLAYLRPPLRGPPARA